MISKTVFSEALKAALNDAYGLKWESQSFRKSAFKTIDHKTLTRWLDGQLPRPTTFDDFLEEAVFPDHSKDQLRSLLQTVRDDQHNHFDETPGQPSVPQEVMSDSSLASIAPIALSTPVQGLVENATTIPFSVPLDPAAIRSTNAPHLPTKDNYDKFQKQRMSFLHHHQTMWIHNVLDATLTEHVLSSVSERVGAISLEMRLAPEAVLVRRDYPEYDLPDSAQIVKVFYDMNQKMLILGDPGAGKTILLLHLGRYLIEYAQHDSSTAIPVILNLSSWGVKRLAVAEWVMEELSIRYRVDKKAAAWWIKKEKLILLLDGLDELRPEYRSECVNVINVFCAEHTSVRLIVCSRTEDYEHLVAHLNVYGAVELQPLAQTRVDEYLRLPEFSGLREILKIDSTLRELSLNPYLFHVMMRAYYQKPLTALALPVHQNSLAERLNHLFDCYIEHQLHEEGNRSAYAHQETRHYMSWLAQVLEKTQQTVFRIEELQPNLLPEPLYRRYRLILGVIMDLSVGVISGVQWTAPIFGILAGIIWVPLFLLLTSPVGNWRKAIEAKWMMGLTFSLLWGLAGYRDVGLVDGLQGIISGFILGVLSVPGEHIVPAETISITFTRQAIIAGIGLGVGVGLTAGIATGNFSVQLSVGVISAVVGLFAVGLNTSSNIDKRFSPNQGIYNSFQNMVWVTVFFSFLASLSYYHHVSVSSLMIWSLAGGLFVGVTIGGGESVLQHIILRKLLHGAGWAPRNYAQFLSYGVSLGILRHVGNGYIFVHRYLRDYFAQLSA